MREYKQLWLARLVWVWTHKVVSLNTSNNVLENSTTHNFQSDSALALDHVEREQYNLIDEMKINTNLWNGWPMGMSTWVARLNKICL